MSGIANVNDTSGPCWSFAAVSRAFTDDGTLSPFARNADGTPHPFASGVSFDLYQCDEVTAVQSGCPQVLKGLQFVNDNDRILIRIANDYANHFYVGSNLYGYLQMVSTAGNGCASNYGGELNIGAQRDDVFPNRPNFPSNTQFGVLWYAYGSEPPVMMLAYSTDGTGADASPVVGMFTTFTADNRMTPGNCSINIGTLPFGEFSPFDWSYDKTSMKLTGTDDIVHASTANSAAFFTAVVSYEPYNSISTLAVPRPTFSTLTAPIDIVYYNYLPFAITLSWYAAPGGGTFYYDESCDSESNADWCSYTYTYSTYTTNSLSQGSNSGTISNIHLAGYDSLGLSLSPNITVYSMGLGWDPPKLPVFGAHPFLINPTCDIIVGQGSTYTVDWTAINIGGQIFYPNTDNSIGVDLLTSTSLVFFVGNVNDSFTASTPAVNSYYICPLEFVIKNNSHSITVYYGSNQNIAPGTSASATVYIRSLDEGLQFEFATDAGSSTYPYALTTGSIVINNSTSNCCVQCTESCPLQPIASTSSAVCPVVTAITVTKSSLQYNITLQDVPFTDVTIAAELLPVTISNCNGYYINSDGKTIYFSKDGEGVTISGTDLNLTVPFVVYVTTDSLSDFQLATAF